jgi:hypothetical protein
LAKTELIKRWRTSVAEHLAEYPLELTQTEDPLVAYGTTILSVAANEEGLLFLQIGDGDILVVSENGEVKRPLPADQRLFANETTSLCSRTAEDDCRVIWVPESTGLPSLVMLATDGYSNSFRDDTGFLKAASDLHTFIANEGQEAVEKELEGWLEETSDQGSGDDITLAVLYSAMLPPHTSGI